MYNYIYKFFVYIVREVFEHLLAIEYIHCIIVLGAAFGHDGFNRFFVKRIADDIES